MKQSPGAEVSIGRGRDLDVTLDALRGTHRRAAPRFWRFAVVGMAGVVIVGVPSGWPSWLVVSTAAAAAAAFAAAVFLVRLRSVAILEIGSAGILAFSGSGSISWQIDGGDLDYLRIMSFANRPVSLLLTSRMSLRTVNLTRFPSLEALVFRSMSSRRG